MELDRYTAHTIRCSGGVCGKTCPTPGWERYDDAQGRFILGWSENTNLPAQETRALRPYDDTGGNALVTLTIEQIPSHRHLYERQTDTGGGCGLDGCGFHSEYPVKETTAAGGSQPHNNMPPYIALTYCKKV